MERSRWDCAAWMPFIVVWKSSSSGLAAGKCTTCPVMPSARRIALLGRSSICCGGAVCSESAWPCNNMTQSGAASSIRPGSRSMPMVTAAFVAAPATILLKNAISAIIP